MGRPLRFIPQEAKLWTNEAGEPVAVVVATMRCIQGRHLLRPGDVANGLILGILGRAQHLYGFEVYAYQFLSNHYDLMLGVESAAQAAAAFHHINTNLSKELGREEVHDWKGPMFERRVRSIMVLTEEDLIDRFRYILAHGVKENLVERCVDWPGAHCARPLIERRTPRGGWVDRTRLWRIRNTVADRKKKPTRRANEASVTRHYPVRLSKLPCWEEMTGGEYQAKVRELCREIEEEAAAERKARGIEVVGAARVLALPPHYHSVPERSPAPPVYCKDYKTLLWYYETYAEFFGAFRHAQNVWTEKRWDPEYEGRFPEGGIPPGRPDPPVPEEDAAIAV